jgi:hypothetical protein
MSTILCPGPEAVVVPARGCCSVVSGGRSIVGAGLGATLYSVSVALVVPAVGVGSVMSRGRSVVGAAVPGAVVTVSGAGGTVPGTGAVPLGAEGLHPPRQLINACHQLGVVSWVANASERRPGDGLRDTVCIVGRSVQRNFGMAYESGLDVVG